MNTEQYLTKTVSIDTALYGADTAYRFAYWLARHTQDVILKSFYPQAHLRIVLKPFEYPRLPFAEEQWLIMTGRLCEADGHEIIEIPWVIRFELKVSTYVHVTGKCREPAVNTYFNLLMQDIRHYWKCETQTDDDASEGDGMSIEGRRAATPETEETVSPPAVQMRKKRPATIAKYELFAAIEQEYPGATAYRVAELATNRAKEEIAQRYGGQRLSDGVIDDKIELRYGKRAFTQDDVEHYRRDKRRAISK